MKTQRGLDFDLVLTQWLEETASPRRVDYLDTVLEKTSSTRQRPSWSFPSRWLPFRRFAPALDLRPALAPQMVWLLLVLATLLTLIVGALAAQNIRRLPPPYGLARPGLVAVDTNHHIAVMNPDGTGLRLLTTGNDAETAPVWSPDGTRLAFWRLTADQHFSVVITDAAGVPAAAIPVAQGPPLLPLDDSGWADVGYALGAPSFLAWSPDSRQLLFSKEDATGTSGVWVVDADGTDLRQLGDPALPAIYPVWSYDGTRIVFHGGSGSADEGNGIYVMNADGTGARKVSHVVAGGYSFNYPLWQPGGELIAFFASPDDEMRIFVVRSDGTGERAVSSSPFFAGVSDWNPTWSPDGTRLAFKRISDEHRGGQIVLINPDGSGMVVPPDQPYEQADLGGPMWSPDGLEVGALLYSKENGVSTGVVCLDVSGVKAPRVIPATNNSGGTSWQRLAP